MKRLSVDLTQESLKLNLSQNVVQWYHKHGRKDLPWQLETGQNKPYHVWLSEIMLQQTQVVKVKDYFTRFITDLPTLKALAKADEQQVLALWSGLGYYNRARNLHKTAQLCVKNHAGNLPCDLQQLIDLPGIGRSTAAAIMSLAYQIAEPIMDGNVKRVFSRHFMVGGEPNKSSTLKELWRLAEQHREVNQPSAYTQGLMDLGATICTKNKPQCQKCPIEKSCAAKANNVIEKYPQKKRKVKQKEVDYYVLLSRHNGQVALNLRGDKSIWPNLWFLPLFENEETLISHYPKAKHKFSFTHKLSHRILQIHVYVLHELLKSEQVDWIDLKELKQYPHPKALNHLLEQYENH